MKFYILFFVLLCTFVSFSQNKGSEKNKNQNYQFQNNLETPALELKEAVEEENAPELMKKTEVRDENIIKTKDVEQQLPNQRSLKKSFLESRGASFSNTSRTIDVVSQKKLDKIVDDLEKTESNSFEFHSAKYINGNHNTSLFAHLNSAYKKNPKDKEVLKLMTAFYEIKGDLGQKKAFAQKLKAERPFSNETYTYLKNVLNSVPSGGVLVTHGSLDTYPLFILNEVDGIRKDVSVISLDLMQSEAYRDKIKKEGFVLPESKEIDTKFFKSFCESNKSKNIYLSMTIPKNYFTEIKSKLFITGLVFKYSEFTIENVVELKKNWESFDKTLFEKSEKPSNESIQLVSNYLLPLITLKKQYQQEENFAKSEELGAYVQLISRWKNNEKTVQKILKN